MSENPFSLARRAADALRERTGVDRYDLAVVLGSGWKEGAAALGTPTSDLPTTELPGFIASTVPGHGSHLQTLRIGDRTVALLTGRVHLYEGNSPSAVVHPVRTLIEAGASRVVLTNAAGGLDPTINPGSVVVIKDHLNLTGSTPLEGPNPPDGYGSRFVDLSDAYSARLRGIVSATVPGLAEGVYGGFRGPQYETRAEIAMIRTMGATLVGMSTVLETIAARHLGAEVLGLSLVSNFAVGIAEGPLNHLEVLETGQQAAASLGTLLGQLLPVL
jgi:purine-nucleoside phosphorylase